MARETGSSTVEEVARRIAARLAWASGGADDDEAVDAGAVRDLAAIAASPPREPVHRLEFVLQRPPDDPEALATALRRLVEDSGERQRLAAGARAVAFPSWREQAALFARALETLA